MGILAKLKENALKLDKSIILPDGNDERTIKAAYELLHENICKVSLVGDAKYILPIYSPIMPRDNNCTPPKKHIILIVLDQPDTVLPWILPTIAQIINKNEIIVTKSPSPVIILIGFTDKLVIPSKASANIFFNG